MRARPQPRTVEEKSTLHPIVIFHSERDGGYIAEVPDLPGCSAFGDTREKALQEVQVAMRLWLKTAHEVGKSIPDATNPAAVH